MSAESLEDALRRLRRPPSAGVDISPASTFDALLEQRIRDLERHVEEVKARVNGLLFLVVGAAVVQVVLGIVG